MTNNEDQDDVFYLFSSDRIEDYLALALAAIVLIIVLVVS